MGRAEEYQPFAAKEARHPGQRDEGILLQIQRPPLCQGREA